MSSTKEAILVLGGTGKVSSRLVPILDSGGYPTLVASRSGMAPSLPNVKGIKFDWNDVSTYSTLFSTPIAAVFLVQPPVMDLFTPMKKFIDIAKTAGTRRFVQLSASVMDVGDAEEMGKVSKYVSELGVEYAILRPTWFMENFSEQQHLPTIRDQSSIITATGAGKIPFVSVSDIANVAFRTLTDNQPHNTDYLILGPELFSYGEVAEMLSKKLGRDIKHVDITEAELAKAMSAFMPEDYAVMLAQLDTAIKEGKEERLSSDVKKVTGKEPKRLEVYIDECVERGVWVK